MTSKEHTAPADTPDSDESVDTAAEVESAEQVAPAPVDEETSDPEEDPAQDPEREHSSEDAAPTPTRRRGVRSVVRWAAVGVLVAVLATVGYGGWLLFEHHRTDVAAEQALDAAKKFAVTLTSVDPNAIDKNFSDVLDGSTGDFKDMYSKSSAQLRQVLVENKAAARGTVVEAAVKSAAPDRVDVLLFVDQSVSNAALHDPQMDRSRVNMTMEKVDGRWLASKVDLP